jgi:hypothetical protein
MTSPPPIVDGQLPPGRWVCTEQEAKAAYVDGRLGDREAIWGEWQQLTGAVRAVVGEIPACWLSGSFFTDKPDPADLDCVYIIEATRVQEASRASPRHGRFLWEVTTSQVKGSYGLRVDSFVLNWVPTPGPTPPPEAKKYLERRGYWDDLWSRVRDNDLRLDAIPRRGYLEVHLDGYK